MLGPLFEVVTRNTFPSQNAKSDGFGPLFELRMWKNCTPLWLKTHFQVKMYKTHHARTTFGIFRMLKNCTSRCIFSRQNFKSQCSMTNGLGPLFEVRKNCTPLWREAYFQELMVSDNFLKLGCGKIARRCGAKHVFKSKCTKHIMLGPFF